MDQAHLEVGKAALKRLVDAGHTAYFAGGWVRDFLMNNPSDDIDIATSASPTQVQELFEKTIPVGINFGVVIAVFEGHSFEIATFRSDRAYIDGRRPTGIDPATPEEDAKRRDFTINGMFYDPLEEKLYDYIEGRQDIQAGIVRAIGDPNERFAEDRLRMMRAVRYAARFHFIIEKNTIDAIVNHSNELLNAVAIERVWQEFEKMNRFPHFELGIITMYRLGLLQVIFPELAKLSLEDIQDRVRHIPHFPNDTPLIANLLELFPHFTPDQIITLCDRFKVSNKIKAFATAYNAHVKRFYIETKLDDYQWAKAYADPHFDISFKLTSLKFSPEKQATFIQTHTEQQTRLKPYIERIQNNDPILQASHLEKEGIVPGKAMGLLLFEGEKLSINEALTDPDTVIDRLRTTPHWPNDER